MQNGRANSSRRRVRFSVKGTRHTSAGGTNEPALLSVSGSASGSTELAEVLAPPPGKSKRFHRRRQSGRPPMGIGQQWRCARAEDGRWRPGGLRSLAAVAGRKINIISRRRRSGRPPESGNWPAMALRSRRRWSVEAWRAAVPRSRGRP